MVSMISKVFGPLVDAPTWLLQVVEPEILNDARETTAAEQTRQPEPVGERHLARSCNGDLVDRPIRADLLAHERRAIGAAR
jgi:hypothetical protein